MTHTPTEIAAMIDDLECIDRGGVLHAKRPKQPHPICDKAAAMLRDVAAERDALAKCVAAADKLVPIAETLVARVEAFEAERDRQPPSAPIGVKP